MLLSIITVTLNCVDTIERTIESIVSQKNDGIEYIIIDGGSTDGTLDIVKKYDDQIDYWISEPDNGIYDAMNKGIKASHGEWINFMNGNDWFEIDALNSITCYLSENQYQIVYGKIRIINNGKFVGYSGVHQLNSNYNPELIHFKNLYCHQGLFINRDLFLTLGLYNVNNKVISDYEWLLKAHNMGIDPLVTNVEVGYFSAGGISCSDVEKIKCLQLKVKNFKGKEFDEQLSKVRNRIEYDLLRCQNPEAFDELFSSYEEVFMWGKGERGTEIYNILKSNNILIKKIISKEMESTIWKGIDVDYYLNILKDLKKNNNNYIIVIATDKYEEDIVNLLKISEFPTDKYLTMTGIYKWVHEKEFNC